MARSPIEMLIDKACDVTAEDLALPAPKRRDVDHDTQALMDVGTAAVEWLRARDKVRRAEYVELERKLVDAARILAATGW